MNALLIPLVDTGTKIAYTIMKVVLISYIYARIS